MHTQGGRQAHVHMCPPAMHVCPLAMHMCPPAMHMCPPVMHGHAFDTLLHFTLLELSKRVHACLVRLGVLGLSTRRLLISLQKVGGRVQGLGRRWAQGSGFGGAEVGRLNSRVGEWVVNTW